MSYYMISYLTIPYNMTTRKGWGILFDEELIVVISYGSNLVERC